MASLSQIGDAIATALDAQLSAYSVTTVKGSPSWGDDTELSPPACALSLDSHQHREGRLSSIFLDWSWQIVVYGDYEEEMWDMVEILTEWLADTGSITAGSDKHKMQLASADRQFNETEMIEEDHAFVLTVVTQGI